MAYSEPNSVCLIVGGLRVASLNQRIVGTVTPPNVSTLLVADNYEQSSLNVASSKILFKNVFTPFVRVVSI